MNTQKGEVIAKEQDTLSIRFERPAACENCKACDGSKHHRLTIKIKGDAKVGDQVVVAMPEGQVAKASLLAYTVPLIGLLAGLFLGFALGRTDGAAAIGGAGGLCLSLLLVWGLNKRIAGRTEWTPRLISVLPKEE